MYLREKVVETRNSLPEKVRMQVAGLLQERLSDAISLALQAKQAHWNVKGPNFIALHELFDDIAEDAEDYVDLIAERIMQLGGSAQGTAKVAASQSSLPDYPLEIKDGKEHVEALSHSLSVFGELLRQGIARADELGDRDSSDIFTEISRKVDKFLWFVEAHVQTER